MRRWKSSLSQKIDTANAEAISRLGKADIVLQDIQPAGKLIPALSDPKRKLVLLSGPPVGWDKMCNAQVTLCNVIGSIG